jgi:hypothetical protein
MKIDGQCHCGFMTYEAEIDPQLVSICPAEAANLVPLRRALGPRSQEVAGAID